METNSSTERKLMMPNMQKLAVGLGTFFGEYGVAVKLEFAPMEEKLALVAKLSRKLLVDRSPIRLL